MLKRESVVADHDVSMTGDAVLSIRQWHMMPATTTQLHWQWRLTDDVQHVTRLRHQSASTLNSSWPSRSTEWKFEELSLLATKVPESWSCRVRSMELSFPGAKVPRNEKDIIHIQQSTHCSKPWWNAAQHSAGAWKCLITPAFGWFWGTGATKCKCWSRRSQMAFMVHKACRLSHLLLKSSEMWHMVCCKTGQMPTPNTFFHTCIRL